MVAKHFMTMGTAARRSLTTPAMSSANAVKMPLCSPTLCIKYRKHGSIARTKSEPEAGQPWRMPLLTGMRFHLRPNSEMMATPSW